MHVIGTAGHVDHGKSTLIAALTGIHPDRLKEEQEREMTIDLGFAWFTLPGGEDVGIVDVPGHSDFIENMLAGVGGIDAVLLVIAADEGIMPQTREHLAILDLLKIDKGIIVLTKIDLVDDPAWLDLVKLDIRKLLQGTALQDALILAVSSTTKAGLPELIQTLGLLIKNSPARPDLGRPRLPVDRVFSMPGFGTIVTGTLSDGHLSTGDEVEILPSGLHARVRGLQTHKQTEKDALPGSRTAVNLSGVNVEQIQRGDVLTHLGQYHPTQRLDVRIRYLPGMTTPLHHHTEVKFFIGTSETIADVRLLGTETLEPGQEAWLQLELRQPVVAVRNDRFILRRPSPAETLGGGQVVDPSPNARHKRFDQSVLKALEDLAQGSPADVLMQACFTLGPALLKDILARSRLEPSIAEAALNEVIASGQLIDLEDIYISATAWADLKASIFTALDDYHHLYPLRHGMPREELKSRLKLAPHTFTLVVTKLATDGTLQVGQRWIALPEHRVLLSPFQKVKVDRLLARFAAAPFAPPSVKECQAEVGEAVFNTLLESGSLVMVSSEVIFRTTDYKAMLEKVRAEMVKNGQISLAGARDLLASSRRYTQALLEYLDAIGITVREGEIRHLKQ